MHLGDNGRIELLPSERHHHTTTLLHTFLQLVGKRVGVLRGNGQGHYDIDVFLHTGKGTKKNTMSFRAKRRISVPYTWMLPRFFASL